MHLPMLLTIWLLGPLAGNPDKFWLEAADKGVDGHKPAVIEGVLLDQTDTAYHVRVEAGEIWLPKSAVVKHEKDALTVASIEQTEAKAHQERLAAQETAAKAAEAAAKAAAKAVADAAAHRAETAPAVVAIDDITPPPPPAPEMVPVYDPVRHVVRAGRESRDTALLRDLELAYQLTGNREYVKLIRKLRRLR